MAPVPKDGRKALIYLGLGSAAFCVPASVPIAVTSAAWALGVPMRFGIITALLVTLVIFLVWFISSESLDLLLRRTESDTRLAGRAASHVVSAIILALGDWLVVESGLAALLMAAVVFVLFVCLAPLIDFWYEKPVTNGGARSAD